MGSWVADCVAHVQTESGWTTTASSSWSPTSEDPKTIALVVPVPADTIVDSGDWRPVHDGTRVVAFERDHGGPATLVVRSTGDYPVVPTGLYHWLSSTDRVATGGRLVHGLLSWTDPHAPAMYNCRYDHVFDDARRSAHGHPIVFADDGSSPNGVPFELTAAPDARPLAAAVALVLFGALGAGARRAARQAEREKTDEYLQREFGWKPDRHE